VKRRARAAPPRRRRALAGWAALALSAASPAFAQTLPPPGASACSGCHGGGAFPSLHGSAAADIAAAMRAYRTGERSATVMDRIAKGFTDEETEAIAAWLASKR
jgi:cytochrome c553